jgi:hypothetical protein
MSDVQISIGKDNVRFKPVSVSKLEEFGKLTQEYNWSPGLFRDNYRNKENFISCECIGLDCDNDEDVKMSLEEAREAFAEFKHIIIPSKSHRKEKNGEVKDRFRVILFLSKPITDEATYNATWEDLQKRFPAIDPACRDTSRYYYPSRAIVASNMKGKPIDPVQQVETTVEEVKVDPEKVEAALVDAQQGELSRKTLNFMLNGVRPGQRHRELYLAARDYNQNNYSQEKFTEDLKGMIARTNNWGSKTLNSKDVATISDAFSKDPKHEARYAYTKALLFEPIEDVLNNEEVFEWMVSGLCSVGGCSVLAGSAKKGKSTLTRQLAKSVARGEKFLGRTTKQGTVFIAALEEQKSLLKEQLKRTGITGKDPIRLHVGSTLSTDVLDTLRDELSKQEVRLLIIDTLQLGLKIKELQNYVEVYQAITPFRDLARDTGTHIMFLHHSNKLGVGSNMVSGSKAITGSMDTILMFQDIGKKRFLTTEGRGVDSWYQLELKYDAKTETYFPGTEGGLNEDNSF